MNERVNAQAECMVDYKHNIVHINPLHMAQTKWKTFNQVMTSFVFSRQNLYTFYYAGLISLAIFVWTMSDVLMVYPELFHSYFGTMLMLPATILLVGAIVNAYYSLYHERGEVFYAKYNAKFTKKKKLFITEFPSQDFVFLIAAFNNVVLEYTYTPSNNSRLERIHILKLGRSGKEAKDKFSHWGIQFIFENEPQGELKLVYA